MRNDKWPYIIIIVLAFLTAAGFYFLLEKFSTLREDFKNLEFSFELYKKENAATPISQTANPPVNETVKTPEPSQESIVIPTAILFETNSSTTSETQIKFNVSVESVTKATNGMIEVALKVFNGNDQTYGRLDPVPLFEIIDLQNPSASQEPYKIEGSYDAIPPKSAILGKIFLKISAFQNTMILRIGEVETASFYEFDFQKKSYKEISVG
jgi:hypothetical protein